MWLRILLHPKAPLCVGIALVTAVVWALYISSPLPGGLSSAHAQIHELNTVAGCADCHAPGGITNGCLGCHVEIGKQIEDDRGYHAYLLKSDDRTCVECHGEHNGSDFQLISSLSWQLGEEERFSHPHLDFGLHGKHDELECSECHGTDAAPTFALPDFPALTRKKTFLGLTQECGHCHNDPHAGGLVDDCGKCHGQESFSPPQHFDHGHLPLTGGHANLACADCHQIPTVSAERREYPYPFHNPRGKTCAECHDSPHRLIDGGCEQCHSVDDLEWRRAKDSLTSVQHAATGFALDKPHDRVACADCHEPELPFLERYRDPEIPGYNRQRDSCQGCHEDVHRGQFGDRRPNCIECHEREHFDPTGFGLRHHEEVFPLTGAHRAVPCSDCHPTNAVSGIRMLVGIPKRCASCHDDPHAGQFKEQIATEGCESCHNETLDTFHVPAFAHGERTGYPLLGAHAKAACDSCHIRKIPTGLPDGLLARQYAGTPTDCSSCHRDVHRGQFENRKNAHGAGCETCHTSFYEWSDITFDHDRESSFSLEGNHADVPCSSCHQPALLPDGSSVIQYKPLGQECSDCHEIR